MGVSVERQWHPQHNFFACEVAKMMQKKVSLYGLSFALPMLIWQLLFFALPLVFLVALTFWTVHNFRLEPAFEIVNWVKMYGKGYFWDTYIRTFGLAALTAALTSIIAFPCSYALAFKTSESFRRLAVLLLITPFFTSYLVRVYSWQVFLSDEGIINAILGWGGLGPYLMLNTPLGTVVGYMTLSMPLVILLQMFSLVFIDRSLVEAAHNLRCGQLKTVFLVVIPSARAGLVVAALFCFILSFGDFVSPLYLGGSTPPTLSILITDTTKAGQQWPRAAVIAITMIVTLLTAAFAAIWFAYKRRA